MTAAGVLNSPRAEEVSVFVVRAFVAFREALTASKQLTQELAQLERHLADHDEQLLALVRAIRQLATPPVSPLRRKIGFRQ